MWKFDTETTYKKWSVGMSGRYYSFMENIDEAFELTISGVKDYRSKHDKGDMVFDANAGYQATKNVRVSVIVKNMFNHEFMGRPADMQPMRTFTMQIGMVF
jgi:outer membrane receptor for ferric coprogen and ferric-rhodotorulic acid